jgi:hypothetical protein
MDNLSRYIFHSGIVHAVYSTADGHGTAKKVLHCTYSAHTVFSCTICTVQPAKGSFDFGSRYRAWMWQQLF